MGSDSLFGGNQPAYPVRQRRGFAGCPVYPDDFCAAFRTEYIRIVCAAYFLHDFKAGAARHAGIGDNFHFARIGQRHHEGAMGVDDDGFHAGILFPSDGGVPLDTRLFQKAEVNGVVDVSHGVHVAPADGNDGGMDMFHVFGRCSFHGADGLLCLL